MNEPRKCKKCRRRGVVRVVSTRPSNDHDVCFFCGWHNGKPPKRRR